MAQMPMESWSANTPFNIESTLAAGMMDPAKAGVAAALMSGYQAMRQSNAAQYKQDIAQNRIAMAEQMRSAAMQKAIDQTINAFSTAKDTPGMIEAMMGNSNLAPLMSGNASNYNPMVNAIQQRANAQNLSAAGKGVSDLVDAGYNPSLPHVQGVIGDPNLKQGMPLRLQAAQVSANGGGRNRVGGTYVIGGLTFNVFKQPNETDTQFSNRMIGEFNQAFLRMHGRLPNNSDTVNAFGGVTPNQSPRP